MTKQTYTAPFYRIGGVETIGGKIMDKARLMQFLSDAIDSGAYLSIHMPQFEGENFRPVSREEAEDRAKRFASIVGEPIETDVYGNTETFTVGSTATNGIRGDFTCVVKKSVSVE